MKQVSYLFLIISSLSFASCGKAIPDETMDGRGTFYCKVNGEDYFPECFGFACQDAGAAYLSFGDVISIGAKRSDGNTMLNLRIYIYNVETAPSIVNINDPDIFLDNTFISQDCGKMLLDNEADFKINLTKLDFGQKVVSGTFSGVFSRMEPNHNCIDTIVITDGIFDLPITF